MSGYSSETVVRAWARLAKAQRQALAGIEQALSAAKLPPLAWYDELEREMLLAQYNLSRLIDRLEKAGYVERRAYADDGRGQVVAITPAGKSMRRRMWSVYGPAIQAAIGAHLSPKQIDTLTALLGALIEKSAKSAAK